MRIRRKILNLPMQVISGIILLVALYTPAYAYIDPGTGSLLIQTIIGAIAAIGVTMKLYWHKLRLLFVKKTANQDSNSQKIEEDSE